MGLHQERDANNYRYDEERGENRFLVLLEPIVERASVNFFFVLSDTEQLDTADHATAKIVRAFLARDNDLRRRQNL